MNFDPRSNVNARKVLGDELRMKSSLHHSTHSSHTTHAAHASHATARHCWLLLGNLGDDALKNKIFTFSTRASQVLFVIIPTSAVQRREATPDASVRAVLTTLAGSMMPAAIMSVIFSLAASNPLEGLAFLI